MLPRFVIPVRPFCIEIGGIVFAILSYKYIYIFHDVCIPIYIYIYIYTYIFFVSDLCMYSGHELISACILARKVSGRGVVLSQWTRCGIKSVDAGKIRMLSFFSSNLYEVCLAS